jgi:hypothetical protein
MQVWIQLFACIMQLLEAGLILTGRYLRYSAARVSVEIKYQHSFQHDVIVTNDNIYL